MQRQILIGCLPFVGLTLACVAVAWLLVRLTRVKPSWRVVGGLHSDQRGAVQSLSFVLTIPLFVMVMMMIVQLSQLTIAKVFVEYSAFAAARAAQVWIPAHVVGGEVENQIGTYAYIGELTGDDGWKYQAYEVVPGSQKFQKIHFAAVEACLPICPSRSVGGGQGNPGNAMASSFERALFTFAPAMATNPKVPIRIRNKLSYALDNTWTSIQFRHKENEPPLQRYQIRPYLDEFRDGELGWHDQIIVKVVHDYALLPGPGRLLARRVVPAGSYGGSGGSMSSGDAVADRITNRNGVFIYTLTATARLYNEGEKPMIGYRQPILGPVTSLNASVTPSYGRAPMSDEFQRLHDDLLASERPNNDCCRDALPAAEEYFSAETAKLPSILRGAKP